MSTGKLLALAADNYGSSPEASDADVGGNNYDYDDIDAGSESGAGNSDTGDDASDTGGETDTSGVGDNTSGSGSEADNSDTDDGSSDTGGETDTSEVDDNTSGSGSETDAGNSDTGGDTPDTSGETENAAGPPPAEPELPGEGATTDDKQPEVKPLELSGELSQFVTKAVLIGVDGDELTDPAAMMIFDSIKLRLSIDLDARALAAIKESGDAEYTVHIPEKLSARDGQYELKTRGKLLGTLNVEGQRVYFVFHTEEDSFFSEDEPDALNDVPLDIICDLDKETIGEDTTFEISLEEYAQSGTYNIELKQYILVPTLIPVDMSKDFSQFVAGVRLQQPLGTDVPYTFLMDSGDDIFLNFELKDLGGSDLAAIKNAGDFKYKVDIPEMLVGVLDDYELTLNGGGVLGTLIIDADGAYFVFDTANTAIFNEDTFVLDNLWIDITCKLNMSKIGTNDRTADVDMEPYDDDKTYTIGLTDRTPDEPEMYKSGQYNRSTGLYDWTVTVVAPESSDSRDWLADIKFTDTTGPNHALDDDRKIEVTGKKIVGDDVQEVNTESFDPTSKTATGFTLDLAGPYTGTVTIEYSTALTGDAFTDNAGKPISGDSSIILPNTSNFDWGTDNDPLTASYSISDANNSFLEKDGVFIPGNKSIEWTVVVDTLGQGYEYMNLYDLMSDDLKHEQISVRVNGQPLNTTPTYYYDPVAKTELMTLPLFENGVNKYGTNIITITYTTNIDNMEYYGDDDPTIDNDAWLDFGWKGGQGPYKPFETPAVTKGEKAVSAPVLKEAVAYDPQEKIITWKITVNSNHLDLTDVKVTDTVLQAPNTHGKLTYVPGSLSVPGTITHNIAPDGLSGSFSLPDLKNVEATFRVTTEVTDGAFLTGNTTGTFENKIDMTATANLADSGTQVVSGEKTAVMTPSNNVLKKTAGKYDYSTNTMEWTIVVNSDKINPFKTVVITDTIADVEELADDSGVKSTDPDDITVEGEVPTSKTLTADGFEIKFDDIGGKTVTIKYKTKYKVMPNNVTSIPFSNTVELKSDYGSKTETSDKDVPLTTIKKSAASVDKPDRSTALITYRVLINQSNKPINQTFQLIDTIGSPPAGAILNVDLDSVVLKKATVGANGDFTATADTITLTGKTFAGNILTVDIPTGAGACILEYEVVVRKTDGSALSGNLGNSIRFDGFTVDPDGKSSSNTTDLGSASGSGGDISKYVSVKIIKKDGKPDPSSANEFVSEAVFGLYLKTGIGSTDADYTLVSTAKTNSSGVAEFKMLMPGDVTADKYYIHEISAPTGYVLDPAYIHVTAGTKAGTLYTHTIDNDRTVHTVSFAKVSNYITGKDIYELLLGAQFQITADDENTSFGTRTLNDDDDGSSDGIFTITDLEWGTYTLVESVIPLNYVPNDCTYTLVISKTGGIEITANTGAGILAPATPVVNNFNAGGAYTSIPAIVNEKGSVTITKKDDEGNIIPKTTDLAGAVFKLYEDNAWMGDPVAIGETDENGKVSFYNLTWNKYYVAVEAAPPTGYTKLPDSWELKFIISNDNDTKIHYENDVINEKGLIYEFSFKKADYNDNLAANGEAKFSLYKQSDAELKTPIKENVGIDGSGIVTFKGVAFDNYYIVETVPLAGHALPKKIAMSVELARSVNSSKPTVKITDLTRTPNVVIVDTTIDVNEPFKNEKGSYTITKTDNLYTNTPAANLAGAVFKVSPSRTDAVLTEGEDRVTTGADGKAVFDGLDIDTTYTFTEVAAPEGYKTSTWTDVFTPTTSDTYSKDSTPSAATIMNKTVTVGNDRNPQYGFSFTKVDDNNNPLDGVEFSIALDPAPPGIGSQTFNHANVTCGTDGIVAFSNLPYGSYVVTEVKAPDGYRKNTTPIKFTFAPNGTVSGVSGLDGSSPNYTFKNSLGSFTLTKKDAANGSNMSGVGFDLYKKNSSGGYDQVTISPDTTNGSGVLSIPGLSLGVEYQLRERAQTGYVTPANDAITFTLADTASAETGHTQTRTFNNKRTTNYSFGFKKQDDHGNALSGATFGLYNDALVAITGFDTNGKPVTTGGPAITATSLTTSGNVVFSNLAFGTYYVKELSAPTGGANGYSESDVVLKVDIASDGSYVVSYQSGTVADLSNVPTISVQSGVVSNAVVKNELLGSIKITKTDADTGNSTMSGVGFTLYAADGTTVVDGPKNTDSNGIVTFTGLTLGQKYIIKETTIPTGYEQCADIEITPVYDNTDSSKYNVEQTVANVREGKYSIDFLKHDVSGNALGGATFGIIQTVDIASYADVGEQFTPQKTSVSDSISGIVEFTGLGFGRYFIRETASPAGYSISDTVLQADISLDGSVSLVKVSGSDTMNSEGKTVVISNKSNEYSISFDKIAGNTGRGLKGAKFSITPVTDSDGYTATLPSGTADTAISNGLGKVTFTGLPFATYQIREISAPTNYIKCESDFIAEIAAGGNVLFRQAGDGNPDIVITDDGQSVTIKNIYSPQASGGDGGGGDGGSGKGNFPYVVDSLPPRTTVSKKNNPPATPEPLHDGSTVSDPVVVEKTDDYTVTIQTITTPQGDEYDIANITVNNPNGAVTSEIAPPPPREGYVFGGWYVDPEMTIPYHPGDKLPPGTTRLYAKWYLGQNNLDSNNPRTGDSFPYKPLATSAVLAFITIIITLFTTKKRDASFFGS